MGTNVGYMGNDLADAIRTELRAALLATYGTLEAAAKALGVPYKTLYRHLTPTGKDRTARVTLDFVIEVADHLEQVSNVGLAEIQRRAMLSARTPNVGTPAHNGPTQSDYGLAASRYSQDRGEDTDAP